MCLWYFSWRSFSNVILVEPGKIRKANTAKIVPTSKLARLGNGKELARIKHVKEKPRIWYPLLKYSFVLPICKYWYRATIEGQDNIPAKGGAILACNHIAVGETFLLPALINRRVTYMAKAELFSGVGGLRAKIIAILLRALEQIPLDRSGGRASLAGLGPVVEFLKKGRLVGIYPEGTRSPDGRLYRGKTGVARIALAAGVPVIPVAVFGTHWVRGRLGIPVLDRPRIVVGKPRYYGDLAFRMDEPQIIRWVTDDVMAGIQELSGQEYVDVYGRFVKKGKVSAAELEKMIKDRPGTLMPPKK